jgi:hypothetical protein
MVNAERLRLDEADAGGVPWRRWGPYLSERQWGNGADIGPSHPRSAATIPWCVPATMAWWPAWVFRAQGPVWDEC